MFDISALFNFIVRCFLVLIAMTFVITVFAVLWMALVGLWTAITGGDKQNDNE